MEFKNYEILVSLLPWLSSDKNFNIEKYLSKANKKIASDKSIIFSQGDITNHIYYIKKGTIKISSLTNDGREKIYLFQTEGTFAGLVGLYHAYPSNAFDIAVGECELYEFSVDDFKEMLKNDFALQEAITEMLAKTIRILIGTLASITFNTAKAKVCGLIYLLALKYGKETDKGILIDINLRHEDIASIYSLHRVTVTKIFQTLHDEGIIFKDKNSSVTVFKMEKLLELAEFSNFDN